MSIVKDKNRLITLIQNHKKEIHSFGVERIGIFGSFVRNTPNIKSDIDILVEFNKKKKNFDNFIHLSFFLEDLSGRKIELVTPESLSPYIGPHILKTVEYVHFRN